MKPREELHYKQVYPTINVNKKLKLENHSINFGQKENNTNNSNNSILSSFSNHYPKEKIDFSKIDYNIDHDDQTFLSEQKLSVTISEFEFIIDRMEKEWYFFKHKIIKNTFTPFQSTDQPCNICSFSHTTSTNSLLFCDGCNVCIHQECYGVPIIPPGPWFCKACLHQVKQLSCKFCLKNGGAFKMTSANKWGHVVCVLWNEKLFFRNLVFLEPIEEPESRRYKKLEIECSICNDFKGYHIKCAYIECNTHYHVTCGIEKDFYFDVENLISYCTLHDPRQELEYEKNLPFYPELKKRPKIRKFLPLSQPQKSLLLHIKMLRPFISTYFVDKIYANDICNLNISKDDLIKILLYWRMKRKLVFDAPLIPYLYLDTNGGIGWEWYEKRFLICLKDDSNPQKTDSSKYELENNSKEKKLNKNERISSEEKVENEEYSKEEFKSLKRKITLGCGHKKIKNLDKKDLNYIYEPIRELSKILENLTEIKKIDIEISELQKELLEMIIEPKKYIMKSVMKIIDCDEYEIFKNPVTEFIASGYFKIIKKPMDFFKIYRKIDSYERIDDLFQDLDLIASNSYKYNEGNSLIISINDSFTKTVQDCKKIAKESLENLGNFSIKDIFDE